jgi:hypothetical protein
MAAVRQAEAQETVLSRTDDPRILIQAQTLGRGSEVPTDGSFIGNWNGLALARANWVVGLTITPRVSGDSLLSGWSQLTKSKS